MVIENSVLYTLTYHAKCSPFVYFASIVLYKGLYDSMVTPSQSSHIDHSACSLWKNVATLFSDADSPYRVLMGKPPAEVKMDDVNDTFMPYR